MWERGDEEGRVKRDLLKKKTKTRKGWWKKGEKQTKEKKECNSLLCKGTSSLKGG